MISPKNTAHVAIRFHSRTGYWSWIASELMIHQSGFTDPESALASAKSQPWVAKYNVIWE